jgi:acetoacetyl-CoA synthetase
LFVVLDDDLEDDLVDEIKKRIREHCSPRHVPDRVLKVPEVPRTLSGKKLEVPVKKILAGVAPDDAVSRDAVRDPDALAPFLALARGSTDGVGRRP